MGLPISDSIGDIYCVYDPEHGLSVGLPTLAEAMSEANECLQSHKESGEWTDGAEGIVVVKVVGCVVNVTPNESVMDLRIRPVGVTADRTEVD
jgi:hypothetical protein